MSETIRPTKKQRELLTFIEQFINEHGYSPSYREIMNGLNYTSVATVALHINNLIKRGHLRKRDHSARSLEVVGSTNNPITVTVDVIKPDQEKWLNQNIEKFFKQAEQAQPPAGEQLHQLEILIEALTILGLQTTARRFASRLDSIKLKQSA
jgi:SOS-response transcriptional repressor LexA